MTQTTATEALLFIYFYDTQTSMEEKNDKKEITMV
jgi:hypothetical protein